MSGDRLPTWTWVAPVGGWALLGASAFVSHPAWTAGLGVGLIACVLAAVNHAEVVAHRIGEPYGTLVLALAFTVIEVELIVSRAGCAGLSRPCSRRTMSSRRSHTLSRAQRVNVCAAIHPGAELGGDRPPLRPVVATPDGRLQRTAQVGRRHLGVGAAGLDQGLQHRPLLIRQHHSRAPCCKGVGMRELRTLTGPRQRPRPGCGAGFRKPCSARRRGRAA